MDVSKILLDILIVLLAAKLAAEIADRIGIPAVVGEIAAGIIVGPSVLGLVHESEALRTLAEIGVILLLLEVGLEMDIGGLRSVGRASLSVALIGIAVPLGLGAGAGVLLGMSGDEALFVGAALTATSVGITARVLGDLRALATVEARTVLGAAVADDVLGLVILTVVTRIVTGGSVSALGILGIVAVAGGFIVVATAVGLRIVPPAFAFVRRYSRSTGTLVAVALAFTLAVSELAHAAQLAPIVGAFVAGLVLARSSSAERVRSELAPVGHLFVPVFFLAIGIEVEVGQFFEPAVLGLAGALLVVAVIGKLVSMYGLLGAPGDRLMIGIGMIPRGEVGLIFAAIGLREGVFGQDVYAALLLVVLVTTVGTPPVLRARYLAIRNRRRAVAAEPVPAGTSPVRLADDGTVALVGEPAATDALATAFTVARLAEHHPLGESTLEWLGAFPAGPRRFDDRARAELFSLLREGGTRSWRLLTSSGILERALPELDDAIGTRHGDGFDLDPLARLTFPRLLAVRDALAERTATPAWADELLLAALVTDATADGPADVEAVARRTVGRIGLGSTFEEAVAGTISDALLLPAVLRRADAFAEEPVLQLAVHLGTTDRAEALACFTHATYEGDRRSLDRLDELLEILRETVSHPDLVDRGAAYEVERRREAACATGVGRAVADRLRAAPREYVLTQTTEDLVRHARLCEPPPGRGDVRVSVELLTDDTYRIEVVAPDRLGLIARTARMFADLDYSVTSALAVTWGDRTALTSYRVTATEAPDRDTIAAELRLRLDQPVAAPPAPGVDLAFDDEGSPWYTRCIASGADRLGLLFTLTSAFAAAGASVHAARIVTEAETAVDTFELSSSRSGGKLDGATKARIRDAVEFGVTPPRRGFGARRRRRPAAARSAT